MKKLLLGCIAVDAALISSFRMRSGQGGVQRSQLSYVF